MGVFKSSPVTALQAESSLSHRCSTLLIRTYTKFASSPSCYALHSLLLTQSRAPLLGPLPYQAHISFVERALSFFVSLLVTGPLFFLILEKTSPLGPWFPLSSLIFLSLHTHTMVKSSLYGAGQDSIQHTTAHPIPQLPTHLY